VVGSEPSKNLFQKASAKGKLVLKIAHDLGSKDLFVGKVSEKRSSKKRQKFPVGAPFF
jgi:hypothetical protein